jgi:hypothetical protein
MPSFEGRVTDHARLVDHGMPLSSRRCNGPAPGRHRAVDGLNLNVPDGNLTGLVVTRPGQPARPRRRRRKAMSDIDEAAVVSGSAGPAGSSEEAGQALPDAGFVFDRQRTTASLPMPSG